MEFSDFDTRNYPTLSVKEGYQEWAGTYEESVEDTMDIRLLNKINAVNWQQANTAIDLACGTGRIGIWLKNQGVKHIDGVDFTSPMLELAREKQVYRKLINADILATGQDPTNYDLCTEVLADEHLENLQPLYNEVFRLLKPNGIFVIVGYHPHFLLNGLITHFHRENGDPVGITSYVHLISDHIKAGFHTGLRLVEMDEGLIDDDWLKKKPKWIKYKNRPVSFIMVWIKDRN